MSDQVKDLVAQSNIQVGELTVKGGLGIIGTFTSLSINDWAGLIVAILTGVYMCFQIESAWRNRKSAKIKQQQIKAE